MKAGSIIKAKRKEAQYTQTQLAVSAEVSLPTIQNIEMGKGNPTLNLLQKICAPLDLSLELVSREPDWGLLEECGLPLLGESERSLGAKRLGMTLQDFTHHLLLAVDYEKKDARTKEALAALLWAIHHHYHSFFLYCLDTPKVHDFLKKHPINGKIIKLMRISSSKLSKIL